MDRTSLTPFPSLFLSHEHNSRTSAETSIEIFSDLRLPREILILSWAALLKSYIDQDVLRFVAGDETVAVDSSLWTFQREQISREAKRRRWTCIRFRSSGSPRGAVLDGFSQQLLDVDDPASSDGSTTPTSHDSSSSSVTTLSDASLVDSEAETRPTLVLFYEEDSGHGWLSTSDGVPAKHLPEIGEQLLAAIRLICNFQGHDLGQRTEQILRLSIANPAPKLLEGPELLHQLVHKHRQSSAAAIDFLQDNGKTITILYASLHRRALTLAQKLRLSLNQQMVPKEGRIVIPVLIPQSPELYVALLGILEAGAAFCPLSLDMPEERIRFIINDVSAKVVVTTGKWEDKVPASFDAVVCLVDCLEMDGAHLQDEPAYRQPSPQDLAYVMYSK